MLQNSEERLHQPALMKLRVNILKLSDNAFDIVVVSDVNRDVISPSRCITLCTNTNALTRSSAIADKLRLHKVYALCNGVADRLQTCLSHTWITMLTDHYGSE